jgi:hypothetical protein
MLRDRVDAALTSAIRLLPIRMATARAELEEQRVRFHGQMRVALVGRVSSGKSTLANALLGGNMVATGAEELTFNVNWLRSAPEPELTICYKDGRTEGHRPPTYAALAELTARRRQDDRGYLATIDYVVYAYPNPYLGEFDLIDTPGLDSVFETDSANTMRFLGLDGAGVRADSIRHAAKADALVLVIARGVGTRDEDLLRDFQRADLQSGVVSPVTTVGAFTKIEQYWRADRQDVMAAGRQVADRLMLEGGARRHLYQLCPLASLVGAAAMTFTEQDHADLTELALALEPRRLTQWVKNGQRFVGEDIAGIALPAARRKSLFDRFSPHGIALSAEVIRCGAHDQDTLRRELSDRSGMTAFRRLLVEHFGHSADLIKLQGVIAHVRELVDDVGDGYRFILAPPERTELDRAAAQVTQLEFREHAFREFTVIRDYYDGVLEFRETDAREALRVTGEHGRLPWQRLGMDANALAADLASQARKRRAYWAMQANDLGHNPPTRRASQIVLRSHEELIHHAPVNGHDNSTT